jgi:hypothetical protein
MENIRVSFGADSPHLHLRLGGVIKLLLKSIFPKNITGCFVVVSNDIWRGKFTVPDAIGFSTPISLLFGGYLILRCEDEKTLTPQFEQQFLNWSHIFSINYCQQFNSKNITTDSNEISTEDSFTI